MTDRPRPIGRSRKRPVEGQDAEGLAPPLDAPLDASSWIAEPGEQLPDGIGAEPTIACEPGPREPIDAESIPLDDLPSASRRRRSRMKPLTVVLLLALAASVGFFGGVRLQKSRTAQAAGRLAGFQGGGTGGGGFRAGGGAGFGQGGFGQGAGNQGGVGGSAPVAGNVKLVDGNNIYVTDSGGNITKVTTTSGTNFSKLGAGALGDIKPGDRVLVQGSPNPDGTVPATSVTDQGAPAQ
jgi:hypothetical protein